MTERWHRLASECRHSAMNGDSVVVDETGDDGRAEVRFVAPEDWRLEKIDVDHRRPFDWLKDRKSADGLVLARPPHGRWQAHIVECKKTIKDKSWAHVRAQFLGSSVRVDAIAGVVGIEIEQVFLYTAFRRDRLGADSPDPVLGRVPVGTTSNTENARGRAAWRASTLELSDIGPLPHTRLPLTTGDDDVGRADIEISEV